MRSRYNLLCPGALALALLGLASVVPAAPWTGGFRHNHPAPAETFSQPPAAAHPAGHIAAAWRPGQAQSTGGAVEPAQRLSAASPRAAKGGHAANYGQMRLTFEPNEGQSGAGVRFLSHGSGYTLLLSPADAVLALKRSASNRIPAAAHGALPTPDRSHHALTVPTRAFTTAGDILRMRLLGANPGARMTAETPTGGKSNYFIGSNPTGWHINIPQYRMVRASGVYPGIDLVYYGKGRLLEHDFIVSPGASASEITLSLTGSGMSSSATGKPGNLRLMPDGNLNITTTGGVVQMLKPQIYQEVDGRRQSVSGGYFLRGQDHVGFQVANYNHQLPLIIDPVLSYSAYLGGSNDDVGSAIAVDSTGSAYIAGYTASTDFLPTPSGIQAALSTNPSIFTTTPPTPDTPTEDAFVVKLDPSGGTAIYSTYLGGQGNDRAAGIAVDSTGAAYITGTTTSTGTGFATSFPTTSGGFQSTSGNGLKSFVTKIDPTGASLVYSQIFGASGDDQATAIAVDSKFVAYITGSTNSPDLNTLGAFQNTYSGNTDGFVARIDAAGAALTNLSYLGGSGEDHPTGIAVDATGLYVTGWTTSPDFPTTAGAFQTVLKSPGVSNTLGLNGFVTKINFDPANALGGLFYSTYLGGTGQDYPMGIAVDASARAYVAGQTSSNPDATSGFPSGSTSFQKANGEQFDAFVSCLNSTGAGLVYSTYLGGGSADDARGISVDSFGDAFVTGQTSSADFPASTGAFQPALKVSATTSAGVRTGTDAYVAVLNPSGQLLYATYLGGSDVDAGNAIAADNAGRAYVTGSTRSIDFPITTTILSPPPAPGSTTGTTGTTTTGTTTGANPLNAFVSKMDIPPATPTNLTATPASTTQINLTYVNSSKFVSGTQIQRRNGANATGVIKFFAGGAGGYADVGLVPNTLYFYSVRAVGADGVFSPFSPETSAMTLPTVSTVPTSPTALSATPVSSSQINISYTPGTNAAAFNIYRIPGGSGAFQVTAPPIGQVDKTVTTFADTNLPASTTYTYEIVAVNTVGPSAPSNPATATTLALAPTIVATPLTQSQVALKLSDSSPNIISFVIQRSTNGGPFTPITPTAGANSTSFIDTGLTFNTVYVYRAQAVTAGGPSAYSAPTTVKTSGDTVTGLITASSTLAPTAPLVGVTVQLLNASGGQVAVTTTDVTGAYSFVNLPDGAYTLNVVAPGQATAQTAKVTPDSTVNGGVVTANFTLAPLATLAAGVSMIGVPYDYTGTGIDAATVLGTVLIAAYNPPNPLTPSDPAGNTYLLYPKLPGSSGTQTVPGRGYFVKSSAASPVVLAGRLVTSPYSVTLFPGWNMIGDPFLNPVDTSTLSVTVPATVGNFPANAPIPFASAVANTVLRIPLYTYAPTSAQAAASGYATATTLQPFGGYWLYVDPTGSHNSAVVLTFTDPGPKS